MAKTKDKFKDKTPDNLLLLEGKNDCYVVAEICQQHQLPQTFGLYNSEGHNEVLEDLESLIHL
jgi:hypothetical protein